MAEGLLFKDGDKKAGQLKRDQGMTAWLTERKGPCCGERRLEACVGCGSGKKCPFYSKCDGRWLEVRVSQSGKISICVFQDSICVFTINHATLERMHSILDE